MGESSERYWQATDYVLELARDLIVDGAHVPTDHVDRLLDFESEFLNRVATNIGAAQLLLLADAVPIDLSNRYVMSVLLPPLYPLPAVELEQMAWAEEFSGQVWRAVNGDKSTDDLRLHLFLETSATHPTAAVVNSAMPVIHTLLHKGVALQRVPGPIDPGDKGDITRPYSRARDAIAATVVRLRAWLDT